MKCTYERLANSDGPGHMRDNNSSHGRMIQWAPYEAVDRMRVAPAKMPKPAFNRAQGHVRHRFEKSHCLLIGWTIVRND